MNKMLCIICLLSCELVVGQDYMSKQFDLPNEVNETSGLIIVNGNLVTHNDSGDEPVLYELDLKSGELIRTVRIENATHQDWEDIAQDEDYIYIADMGNNRGNRTNLKIFKISKKDFLSKSSVQAEAIHFSYPDQSTFDSNSKHNFDAEALLNAENALLIFSKNRGDGKTKIYSVPKTPGTHVAAYQNTFDVEGLITGATRNRKTNEIVLCGYGDGLSPFLVLLEDVEAATFVKVDLSSHIGLGSQIEGIVHHFDNKYFISREKVNRELGGFTIKIPQSVFVFDKTNLEFEEELVQDYFKELLADDLKNEFNFKSIKIRNQADKVVLKQKDSFSYVNIKELHSGHYTVRLKVNEELMVFKKIEID